jgi:glycosyltransferase involved in cell wall biosynthesis
MNQAPAPTLLRIAMVAPVATSVPPPLSGSIETMTALLTNGLVDRGHEVTLFATGGSSTRARLHATFPQGYREDPSMWPWELCELFNLSAAVERAEAFDVIHYQSEYYPMSLAFSQLTSTPLLQTLHHSPAPAEAALLATYPKAPFVAISQAQASQMHGLNVVATINHAVDDAAFRFEDTPGDYLLFLGRFTEGKGVVEAVDVAKRAGIPLRIAAKENDYYHRVVAPLVDGTHVRYVGEVGMEEKVALLGGARALLYPVQAGEPFGLVITEALACGTPVAALNRGAVPELVEAGLTGGVFSTIDELVTGLPAVLRLDRATVRRRALERFGVSPMVEAYESVYRRLAEERLA